MSNKKYTVSRLREIALMIAHGLPARLIAEVMGLPPKSVWNICWIYKWPQETLDEMTERGKHRGKRGEYARSCLRQYFIMHPEQRPAPHLQLFREPKEAVESCQSEPPETMREADRDFVSDLKRTLLEAGDAGRAPDLTSWSLGRRVARLEDLAICFRDDLDQLKIARENHDERLKNNHKRIEAFQRCIDELPDLPAAKIEKSIGSLVADLAAKDNQIDRLKEELAAQRRTLGLLSARVESLENHRQDLSWRVSKQEQNQTALIYAEKASAIGAEQFRTLSDKVDKLEERSHTMAKCSDDQVLEIHKRFDALTPQIEGLVTQVTHLTRKYDELSTEQVRPVIKVDHRLDAMTSQIERLQDILTEIAEILPREFD